MVLKYVSWISRVLKMKPWKTDICEFWVGEKPPPRYATWSDMTCFLRALNC